MRLTILFLLTGAFQTFIGHYFGLHGDLPQMQYGDAWGWYVFESLFYSLCHAGFYAWSKNQ